MGQPPGACLGDTVNDLDAGTDPVHCDGVVIGSWGSAAGRGAPAKALPGLGAACPAGIASIITTRANLTNTDRRSARTKYDIVSYRPVYELVTA